MTSLYRWNAKHPRLSMLLVYVFIFIEFVLVQIIASDSFISSSDFQISMALAIALAYFFLILQSPQMLLKKPLQTLTRQCDPYPFLAEMCEQLSYPYNPIHKQMIQVNYAMALRQTGNYARSLEVLNSIPIDDESRTPPFLRYVYYNNLSDIYIQLKQYDEAEFFYQRSLMVYAALKDGKVKQNFSRSFYSGKAESLFRRGEYSEAIAQLAQVPCNNLLDKVENAMLSAKCNMGLGNTEKAKEDLEFIICHGNKLYYVHEASSMLTKLS